MAKKSFQPGDLVRYTANFLRSTGQYASNRRDGVVVGLGDHDMVYVVWNDAPDGAPPTRVGNTNIEKKKTTKDPGSLISAVRLQTGLPIGKFSADGYKTYLRKGNTTKWELFSNNETKDWMKSADRVYDETGKDLVVLSPDDSFVVYALQKEYSQAWQEAHPEDNPPRMPKRGKHKVARRPKGGKKKRASNPRELKLARRLAQGGE